MTRHPRDEYERGVNPRAGTPAQQTATGELLEAVRNAENRDQMAEAYSTYVEDDDGAVDWPAVNAAIVERWSKAALNYIKAEAWKRRR